MQDVRLEYPEDVELVFRNGRLSSIQILDPGWVKMEAGGWPTKGQAMPMNITIDQQAEGVSILVWATKN